jgi:hypothetical protein
MLGICEIGVTSRRRVTHFRQRRQGARDLLGGRKDIVFARGRGRRGFHQAIMHIRHIRMRAIQTLDDTRDGNGCKSKCDCEQQP